MNGNGKTILMEAELNSAPHLHGLNDRPSVDTSISPQESIFVSTGLTNLKQKIKKNDNISSTSRPMPISSGRKVEKNPAMKKSTKVTHNKKNVVKRSTGTAINSKNKKSPGLKKAKIKTATRKENQSKFLPKKHNDKTHKRYQNRNSTAHKNRRGRGQKLSNQTSSRIRQNIHKKRMHDLMKKLYESTHAEHKPEGEIPDFETLLPMIIKKVETWKQKENEFNAEKKTLLQNQKTMLKKLVTLLKENSGDNRGANDIPSPSEQNPTPVVKSSFHLESIRNFLGFRSAKPVYRDSKGFFTAEKLLRTTPPSSPHHDSASPGNCLSPKSFQVFSELEFVFKPVVEPIPTFVDSILAKTSPKIPKHSDLAIENPALKNSTPVDTSNVEHIPVGSADPGTSESAKSRKQWKKDGSIIRKGYKVGVLNPVPIKKCHKSPVKKDSKIQANGHSKECAEPIRKTINNPLQTPKNLRKTLQTPGRLRSPSKRKKVLNKKYNTGTKASKAKTELGSSKIQRLKAHKILRRGNIRAKGAKRHSRIGKSQTFNARCRLAEVRRLKQLKKNVTKSKLSSIQEIFSELVKQAKSLNISDFQSPNQLLSPKKFILSPKKKISTRKTPHSTPKNILSPKKSLSTPPQKLLSPKTTLATPPHKPLSPKKSLSSSKPAQQSPQTKTGMESADNSLDRELPARKRGIKRKLTGGTDKVKAKRIAGPNSGANNINTGKRKYLRRIMRVDSDFTVPEQVQNTQGTSDETTATSNNVKSVKNRKFRTPVLTEAHKVVLPSMDTGTSTVTGDVLSRTNIANNVSRKNYTEQVFYPVHPFISSDYPVHFIPMDVNKTPDLLPLYAPTFGMKDSAEVFPSFIRIKPTDNTTYDERYTFSNLINSTRLPEQTLSAEEVYSRLLPAMASTSNCPLVPKVPQSGQLSTTEVPVSAGSQSYLGSVTKRIVPPVPQNARWLSDGNSSSSVLDIASGDNQNISWSENQNHKRLNMSSVNANSLSNVSAPKNLSRIPRIPSNTLVNSATPQTLYSIKNPLINTRDSKSSQNQTLSTQNKSTRMQIQQPSLSNATIVNSVAIGNTNQHQKLHKCSSCNFSTQKLGVMKRHELSHSKPESPPDSNEEILILESPPKQKPNMLSPTILSSVKISPTQAHVVPANEQPVDPAGKIDGIRIVRTESLKDSSSQNIYNGFIESKVSLQKRFPSVTITPLLEPYENEGQP